jgi:hypothetical protein
MTDYSELPFQLAPERDYEAVIGGEIILHIPEIPKNRDK